MAAPINLELLTDFFNKIGPKRQIVRRNRMSAFGRRAEVAFCSKRRNRIVAHIFSRQIKPRLEQHAEDSDQA